MKATGPTGPTYNSKEGCHCHRLGVVDEVGRSVEQRVPRPHHAAHREGVQDGRKRLRWLLYHTQGTVEERLQIFTSAIHCEVKASPAALIISTPTCSAPHKSSNENPPGHTTIALTLHAIEYLIVQRRHFSGRKAIHSANLSSGRFAHEYDILSRRKNRPIAPLQQFLPEDGAKNFDTLRIPPPRLNSPQNVAM